MNYNINYAVILSRWDELLRGAAVTLSLAVFAAAIGFVIGTLIAIGRRDGPGWLRGLCAAYTEVIRNTPFLVQIFIMYFGLASIGVSLSAFVVATAALAINTGAYSSEIMRAGFDSIAKGQVEAAECLGLTRAQVYWHVLLVPAAERVYPSLASQYILLMLGTSVTSQISAEELTAVTNGLQAATFRAFEAYTVAAAIYLFLSLVMRAGFALIAHLLFPYRHIKLGKMAG